MRTIAIINQKGGTGKTTTAINLACVFANRGERTLLVDMDPQGHCALGLAIPTSRLELQVGDAMLEPAVAEIDRERLLWKAGRNLDLMPSSAKLARLEAPRGGLAERLDRDEALAHAIAGLADDYEWCLIDCSPSIGLLTFNAIRAADEVLIPVETGYFALHGASAQTKTIEAMGRRVGRLLPHHVVATMHDPSSSVSKDVLRAMERTFGDRLVPSEIRRDSAVPAAAALGRSAVDHDPMSDAASDYETLATWLTLHPPEQAQPVIPGIDDVFDDGSGDGLSETDGLAARGVVVRPTDMRLSRTNGSVPAIEVVGAASSLLSRANQVEQEIEDRMEKRRADPRVAEVLKRLETSGSRQQQAEAKPTVPHHDGAGVAGVRSTSQGTLFVLAGEVGRTVAVAGSFNGWSDRATPLEWNSEMAVYEATVRIPPGKMVYRYVVDGVWQTDPANPLTEPNEFGDLNSVHFAQ